jgi:hypothetical protein
LSYAPYRLACLLFALAACLHAETPVPERAEPAASTASPETSHLEQVPKVPGLSTLWNGLNAGVTISGVHDSSIGWYNVVTPALSYTFSQHYAADASLSIYPYRLVQKQASTLPPIYQTVVSHGEVGDTLIGVHASFNPKQFHSTTTAYMTLPTGDSSNGLGTGKVTFDFSHDVEHYFGPAALLVNLGAGDSSGLFNSVVTKDYNSVGPLVHFQAGAIFWLPGRSYIESVAYEQLPFGDQTVYIIPTGQYGMPFTVVTGTNRSEDNGFTTQLGIPLTDHIVLSGYYNRSLRQHLDTVSTGITYVLHGAPRKRRLSIIDKALREAAGISQ